MPTELKHVRSVCFFVFLVVLSGLGIIGNGCVTTPGYQPKAASSADGAQVRGNFKVRWTSWYKITLEQVDGRKVHLPWWRSDRRMPILLDAGDRTLRVRCDFSNGWNTDSVTTELTASLHAGHSYQLDCGMKDNAASFWLEDAETHLRVGEPTTADAPRPPAVSQTAAAVAAALLLRVLLFISTGG